MSFCANQQGYRKRRADDIQKERYPGVTGSEFACREHFADVTDCIAEQEDGSRANGGSFER